MRSILTALVLGLVISLPLKAQTARRVITSAAGVPTIYYGLVSTAVAPLAGGGAAVASYIVGYSLVGAGAYAMVYGAMGLSRNTMALHRGVAQEDLLRDELPQVFSDLEAGRILKIQDIQQPEWRSYLTDLSQDAELRVQVEAEVGGSANLEQKIIANALIDLMI